MSSVTLPERHAIMPNQIADTSRKQKKAVVEFTITDQMVDAAAQEICDSGIIPFPCYPHRLLVAAREILEAALAVRPQSQ